MGFKRWLRKILIDEATTPQFEIQQPFTQAVKVEGQLAEMLTKICNGAPYFIIIESRPGKVESTMFGMKPVCLKAAMCEIAEKVPEMKELLTNVAIDINAPQNAKQSENR